MATITRPQPPNANIAIIDIKSGMSTYEFTLFLQQLYLTVSNNIDSGDLIVTDITALSEELNATQTGAGLTVAGLYIQEPATNYIPLATSLANATILLDTQIKQNADAITTASLGLTVLTKTANYTATAITQTLLCNAASGNITITLPSAVASYTSNRSISIGISKIDTSVNTITIVGTGGATIGGETSQVLYYQNEVINLVTDGINWWIGA